MKAIIASLLIGCVLGGTAVTVFRSEKAAPPRAERDTSDAGAERLAEDQAKRITELQSELADATAKLEDERMRRKELESAALPPKESPADPDTPVTDEELKAGLKKFAGQLQAIILGKDEGKAKAELRALLKRAGPEAIVKIQKRFKDPANGFEGRLIAAHALGQSGDPDSIAMLADTLRDPDADMLEHRVASHALAFSDAPDLAPLLTQVARSDPDPGARANSAFGLIQRDIDEGYQLYAEATDLAFEKGQPEALQFLQGFFIMKDKALPHVRERLTTYTNETALIVLIELVKQKKDKGALEQLKKLAYDSGKPKSVQNAAQGAIKSIGKE